MPASTADLRFADVSLSTGVHLRYAERGAAAGEPVVFLHGFSDSWFSFSPILPLLPPALRCFAPDQRGHGE
jgi:pimeloyl-ACP methyl ester carboxylesterase